MIPRLGMQYCIKPFLWNQGKFNLLMKNRLLVIGGLIASIAGVFVIFDALGVSDLRRCHTTA